jgi:hypothetical protein
MAAAALHVLLVIAFNVIGRYGLLPNTFDEHGTGISFALDSTAYRQYIISFLNLVERDGLAAWITNETSFHVKLYSVCYAALGKWLGYNTLSAEPLNLIYYLLILVLVFLLGREVFDRRVGILAAGLTAVWPSLLLHTTQLLRDPLFIGAVLGLLLTGTILLKRVCSWKGAIGLAFAGAFAANIIWLIRSQMWEVMIAVAALQIVLMLLPLAWKQRMRPQNLAGGLLLLLIVLSLPEIGRRWNLYSYPPNKFEVKESSAGVKEVVRSRRLPPGSSLPERISYLRRGFIISYPDAGSNIDKDVEFRNFYDIILYLPRAMEIGVLAPFPNMWFVAGPQVGLIGRVVSGFETTLMYGVEVLAIVCLWRKRREMTAWLLFLSATVGMLALGLVVANIATLYRMRYAFWILLLILGIKGALILLSQSREDAPSREEMSAAAFEE